MTSRGPLQPRDVVVSPSPPRQLDHHVNDNNRNAYVLGKAAQMFSRKATLKDEATSVPAPRPRLSSDGGGAIVYEAHKRSSKFTISRTVLRNHSAEEAEEDEEEEEEEEEGGIDEDESFASSPPLHSSATSPPAYDDYPSISLHPEPFDRSLWSEPPGPTFPVRGRTYLSDRIKVPSDQSLFRLITADIIEVTSVLPRGGSVCLHSEGRVQSALRRTSSSSSGPDFFPPFLFVVNIRIPHPKQGREYHIVAYFAVDDISLIDGTGSCPSSKLARRFFFGSSGGSGIDMNGGGGGGGRSRDDDFRDETFKLVPRIVQGNALVRKAVGAKPVLMGRKLKQSYVTGERFLELIINVGSDKVADKIVKMCIGYAKTIVADMAFILEGKDSSALPERVLGTLRLKNIDFKNQRRVVKV